MDNRSVLRNFVLNTSIHGFRYIAESYRHWTERIFWIICLSLSWIASGWLIYSSWQNYHNNAISFVVDTNYLEWDTNFPSVSVCEIDNQEKIAKVTDRVFGDPHDYNLDEIVKEMVYFRGLLFYTLQMCGPEASMADENCLKINASRFTREVRSSCEELLKDCKWNNQKFDCCQFFTPLDTEFGICYAINSIQTRNKKTKRHPMISNRKTGPGILYLEINGNTNVYILGKQEVPSLSSLTSDVITITPHVHFKRYFSIIEIENHPGVKDVNVAQRKCKFENESENLDVFPHYSFSACCIQCRKNAQIEFCDCTHHLMLTKLKAQTCNMDGLYCLSNHYKETTLLKPGWSNKPGLTCDCLPSCTEMEISTVKEYKNGIPDAFGILELSLDRLPTERYKRNVVKGSLDLVVSMGGVTAFFLGASLLSFFETLYYLLIRPHVR